MKIIGIIPARYASTRFPGKPLHPLAGKPLIQYVVERCHGASTLSEVIVATDDERIAEVAREFCRVEMTSADHPSGTDRIAEVASRLDCDAVVNVQGDEPLIAPEVINAVAEALSQSEMTTAASLVNNISDYSDPNVVKVVVSVEGRALYFSRRTVPYVRDFAEESPEKQLEAFPFLKHLGIYGYQCQTLQRLVGYAPSPLEQAEKLEQLRALENGIEIRVCQVEYEAIGVDVPKDVQRVEALLK
ncbi:MAG: 3-deoxy-manno-octulosonate cytidylyltransferase [Verrucomicrobiota bacterium]|nr:3-deoxy-manno-octulosonate cytidylyltransferase [Verrucomicrobiota bacterium]